MLCIFDKRFYSVFMVAIIAIVMVASVGAWAGIESELGENEVKMGREAVEQIAKESKLSTNQEDIARVQTIGNKIAEVANKTMHKAFYGNSRITPFKYTFSVLDDDEINAFCVPGGSVYVYKGLLDFVQSDDELAAVIAHEVTHAAHHHMVYLLREQSKTTEKTALVMLAAVLGGGATADMSNLMLGAQLYNIARVNNYGRDAERDADYGAIQYLTKTGYNPVGMLTFLERLAQRPELVDMGIYRSHPETKERIANVKAVINELGIPIERWRTTKIAKIGVSSLEQNGASQVQVMLNDKVIIRPAAYGEMSAEHRAYDIANRLEEALKSNLLGYDVKAGDDGVVYIRKQPVISVTEADGKLMGKSPAKVAEDAAAAIRLLLWNLTLTTIH